MNKETNLKGSLVRSKTLGTGALRGALVARETTSEDEDDQPEIYIKRDGGKSYEVVQRLTRDRDGQELVKLREMGGDMTVTKTESSLQAELAAENGSWSRPDITE